MMSNRTLCLSRHCCRLRRKTRSRKRRVPSTASTTTTHWRISINSKCTYSTKIYKNNSNRNNSKINSSSVVWPLELYLYSLAKIRVLCSQPKKKETIRSRVSIYSSNRRMWGLRSRKKLRGPNWSLCALTQCIRLWGKYVDKLSKWKWWRKTTWRTWIWCGLIMHYR